MAFAVGGVLPHVAFHPSTCVYVFFLEGVTRTRQNLPMRQGPMGVLDFPVFRGPEVRVYLWRSMFVLAPLTIICTRRIALTLCSSRVALPNHSLWCICMVIANHNLYSTRLILYIYLANGWVQLLNRACTVHGVVLLPITRHEGP